MDTQDIYQKLVTIMSETLSLDQKKIVPRATFESLGVDSLDMLEIIMKIEETFGLEISDEQAAHLKTVQEAVEVIQTLLQHKTT